MINITCNGKEHVKMFNTAATCSFPWRWYLFSPNSCLFCYDSFAREADVSVGDPWLAAYVNDPINAKGMSFVVAHTKFGVDLVENCCFITKNRVGVDEVVQSQSLKEIADKIYGAPGRLQVVLGSQVDKIHWSHRLNAMWFLGWKCWFENIFSKKCFVGLPQT